MSIFTKLGLTTDDSQPIRKATPTPAAQPIPQPQPQYIQQPLAPWPPVPPVNIVASDKETVDKLKALILGSSPSIQRFMQQVEVARAAFPNDQSACLKAALAFTGVAKADLVQELNRTVAAALLHAKKTTETDRASTRTKAVGDLDNQVTSLNQDIKAMEAKIVELQQGIVDKRAGLATVQQKIQAIEVDLQKQDAIISASFIEVEQFIDLLGKNFATL